MLRRARSCCRTDLRGVCEPGIDTAQQEIHPLLQRTILHIAGGIGAGLQLVVMRMTQGIAYIIRKLVDIQHHLARMHIAHHRCRQHEVAAIFDIDDQLVPSLRMSRMAPTPTSPSRKTPSGQFQSAACSISWNGVITQARCAGGRSSRCGALARGEAQITVAWVRAAMRRSADGPAARQRARTRLHRANRTLPPHRRAVAVERADAAGWSSARPGPFQHPLVSTQPWRAVRRICIHFAMEEICITCQQQPSLRRMHRNRGVTQSVTAKRHHQQFWR